MHMNDIEIINIVLTEDKNKYALLIDKYHNELFKYVYNMTGSYTDTEDLLQEIFFKIYKALKKYDDSKASFRTWMYRIAKNYVLNHLQSARTRLKNNTYEYDDAVNRSDEDVEKQAVKNDEIDRILEVMKKILSPKHYEIMHLHYFSNLTVKEISETLSIPDKTIYKAIKVSVEKIKKEVT